MNGFFNINKPAGMTSAQVVNIVKRILGKRLKVGHMGTLDPMATGVLPIAVGRATRLFNFLLNIFCLTFFLYSNTLFLNYLL